MLPIFELEEERIELIILIIQIVGEAVPNLLLFLVNSSNYFMGLNGNIHLISSRCYNGV